MVGCSSLAVLSSTRQKTMIEFTQIQVFMYPYYTVHHYLEDFVLSNNYSGVFFVALFTVFQENTDPAHSLFCIIFWGLFS